MEAHHIGPEDTGALSKVDRQVEQQNLHRNNNSSSSAQRRQKLVPERERAVHSLR